jgi:hypothetical protein
MSLIQESPLKLLYYIPSYLESPYACEARKILDIAKFGMYKANKMVREIWSLDYFDLDFSIADIWSDFLTQGRCLRCKEITTNLKYKQPYCEKCFLETKREREAETLYVNSDTLWIKDPRQKKYKEMLKWLNDVSISTYAASPCSLCDRNYFSQAEKLEYKNYLEPKSNYVNTIIVWEDVRRSCCTVCLDFRLREQITPNKEKSYSSTVISKEKGEEFPSNKEKSYSSTVMSKEKGEIKKEEFPPLMPNLSLPPPLVGKSCPTPEKAKLSPKTKEIVKLTPEIIVEETKLPIKEQLEVVKISPKTIVEETKLSPKTTVEVVKLSPKTKEEEIKLPIKDQLEVKEFLEENKDTTLSSQVNFTYPVLEDRTVKLKASKKKIKEIPNTQGTGENKEIFKIATKKKYKKLTFAEVATFGIPSKVEISNLDSSFKGTPNEVLVKSRKLTFAEMVTGKK